MLEFIYHPRFEKEIAKLKKRFIYIQDGIKSFQNICEKQFHPINPSQVISPGKIHRVTQNDLWTIWKVELFFKQVKPNQAPRIWFAVKGSIIVFLCACSHVDNYDDNEVNRIATDRVTDIF